VYFIKEQMKYFIGSDETILPSYFYKRLDLEG